MPKLKILGLKEERVIKDKVSNNKRIYFIKKTDVLAQQNTSQVIKIFANPNNYSLEDILKLEKKELKGVSDKLKDKLAKLVKQKYEKIKKQKEKEFVEKLKKKFNIDKKGKSNQKKEEEELERDSDSSSEEETSLPTSQELLISKDNNKDKNVYKFNEKEQKAFSLFDLKQLE